MNYDDYRRRILGMDYGLDRSYFRSVNPLQQEPVREPQERRQYTVCGCGNPDCPYGPPETREAFRRGDIPPEMIEEIRRRAMEQQTVGEPPRSSEWATAVPDTSDDEDLLEELREPVEKWIVEAPEQSFSDIIGNEAALGQLRDAIEAPVRHADLYEAYSMTMPKGALLSGPPGCGKTMFARAAASEMSRLYDCEVDMIAISGSELQEPFVGVTEKHIKSIFAYARQYHKVKGHPLLVFIDEAEVLFPDRTGRVRSVAPWEESRVATFLAEMDGMRASGAFVLLASNRPEVIDSALLRDGRCDFKIRVARPTPEALEGILAKNFAGIFTKEDESSLVFAALESLLDPHKVFLDLHQLVSQMEDWFKAKGFEPADDASIAKLRELKRHNFGLEHIVSGAMAASIPTRAKRHAFARDRAADTLSGVTTADVIAAVNDVFEENKNLEHSFAMREFLEQLEADLEKIK